ncbi:MAG: methyltransferase domain-containing protein [Planctomycetes bacterium]|nr:methyltransferase domain-containing protein [Planctomycetota bacterium]
MNRERYSFLAHRTHWYCNPIDPHFLDQILGYCGLGAASAILDVGCGKGELLIRAAERFGSSGIGVEQSELMQTEAQKRASERGVANRLWIQLADAQVLMPTLGAQTFDLVACIGSSHALGGWEGMMKELLRVTKPGGKLLIADGIWESEPSAAYLQALECEKSAYPTHAEMVKNLRERGLRMLGAWTASQREWDEYEWAYCRNIEEFLAMNPDDPEAEAMRKRCRDWSRLYMEEGRGVLGFGVYLVGV